MKRALFLVPLVCAFPLYADVERPYNLIERYVLAPPLLPPIDKWRGNFMKENEYAFIRKLHMTHDEFAAVIIEEYKRSHGMSSNHIGRVMTMLLPNLSDTNTLPFVRSILADEKQRGFWGEALYVLGWRGGSMDFTWFQENASEHRFDSGHRRLFYLACCSRFGWEIMNPEPYPSFEGNPCYDTLKAALESESELPIRMEIDDMFDKCLKGWRISAERESLLLRWLSESEGQDVYRVLRSRLKGLSKARETGETMVVCERPPYKAPSPEEVAQRDKKAKEEMEARMRTPYEGPLVVDMEEEE